MECMHSAVWGGVSHSTIPNYTFTGGTWCVGHLHSNSGWLDHIEPLTTPSQGVHDVYALTQQFGVVRSHSTIPNYTFTWGTRCVRALTHQFGDHP